MSFSISSKLLEYRFGLNFGQVFFDYSGNSNLGVNGISSGSTIEDSIATDRGAYFGVGNYRVTLPSNDQSPSVKLRSGFSILFWGIYEDYTYTLFHRSNGVDVVSINRYAIGSQISLSITKDGGGAKEVYSNGGTFNIRNV